MWISSLRSLSLRKKLVAGFLFTSLITLLIGGKSLITLSANTKSIHRLQEVELALLVTAEQLEILALNHRRYEKDTFLNIGKPDKQQKYLSKFNKVSQKTHTLLNKAADLLESDIKVSPAVKQALAQSQSAYGNYVSGFQHIAEQVIGSTTMTPQAANKLMMPIKDYIYAFEEGIGKLTKEAESLIAEVTQELAANSSQTRFIIGIFVLAGVACSIALGVIISLAISRPMNQATSFAERLAAGDFSSSLPSYSNDEIGQCIQALNRMSEQLKNTLRQVVDGVTTLNVSSSDLFTIATKMDAEAKSTATTTDEVAGATGQMTRNIDSVAGAVEESFTNVSMVAAATEEMAATIDNLAANATQASSISKEAVQQATDASALMSSLGKAANEINQVTETITEISEQTNLLALNATIESARAGEAGKGFAVVANEIKELAKQTASATMDIKNRVSGVQSTTEKAVTQINHVAQVITTINDIISGIATAVGEQSVATREITSNISQASAGLHEVNANIGNSAQIAQSIAKKIVFVNNSTELALTNSGSVRQRSNDLSDLAGQLRKTVSVFTLNS